MRLTFPEEHFITTFSATRKTTHGMRNVGRNYGFAYQEIYDESNQIFGAAKIAAVMKSEGFKVSNEMVHTLMRDMGLVSIRQSAKKLYEDERRKYKNHLNQEFDVNKPNEVWVSDVTYFKYGENAYYICVIIDLFSRMVVGYKIGKTNSTQLVKSTFQIAYKVRQPDSSLIFHTDRGGNYRSKTMNDYMWSLHITHSFSRAHVPYDNSVMESFFSSMKREEMYRTKYRSESDFRSAVGKYIIFYNTKRPHKKLQYKTPEQKEEEYALKDVVNKERADRLMGSKRFVFKSSDYKIRVFLFLIQLIKRKCDLEKPHKY